MRSIIRGGQIVDGHGRPPFWGDIVLENEKITAVLPTRPSPEIMNGPEDAPRLSPARRIRKPDRSDNLPDGIDRLIDATGLTVTPGFIDSHRHGDLAVLKDPSYGLLELAQGITTVINGNCGLSLVPVASETRRAWHQFLEPCLGQAPPDLTLSDYDTYLAAVAAAQPRIHVATLIGTGAIRMSLKGFQRKPFRTDELAEAERMLAEALHKGAPGASCGIMYVPERYTTADEYVTMLKPLAACDRVLSAHIRGEGDSLPAAVREILSISERAGVRLNISHFKCFGIKNWRSLIYQAIELIEQSSLDVTVDFYPYLGGSTTLMTLLPPPIMAETLDQTLHHIAGPKGIAAVRAALQQKHPGWDSMVAAIGWERILISAVGLEMNADCPGKSMADIAGSRGVDPVTLLCDLLTTEKGNVAIINLSMDQADCDAVARLPRSMVISDSLYPSGGKPHPRLYGAFAKAIRDLVIERKVLSLAEAIQKMTNQPAVRYGLAGRGLVQAGYHADLCLFDPVRFADRATYTQPRQSSVGMDLVLVNGQVAWPAAAAGAPASVANAGVVLLAGNNGSGQ